MILSTILMLVLDILSRFDGNAFEYYYLLNSVGNFMAFLLNPILPSIWFLYVNYQIYHDEEKTKRILFSLFILNIVNMALVVISQFKGWYYYIDSINIYHRGPFFIFSTIITISLLFIAFVVILLNRKKINKKHLFSLIFFPIPPFLGIIMQIFIYGISFILNCTVISLLIVLLSIKDDSIFTDYLTGIGNRKKLEDVLKEKMRKITSHKTFSLIILDIDNFKEINDTYGHEMGDNVLKATAELLKSCVHSKDYITRLGGDEFCLIIDSSNKDKLDKTVRRINRYVEMLNDSSSLQYNISFSIGYDIYDYHSNLKAEQFLKNVDILMYNSKRKKKKEKENYLNTI